MAKNTDNKSIKTKKPAGKQNVQLITLSANSGFQEMVQKILNDPENYQIDGSKFNLHTKSSIYSQAVEIGLKHMFNHPKQAPTDAATNAFAQSVAQSLFPLIDARLKTLFEMSVSNYINNKSTNLYTKNILLALKEKFGANITGVSINKLASEINKNIDYVINYEKKQLLKSFTQPVEIPIDLKKEKE